MYVVLETAINNGERKTFVNSIWTNKGSYHVRSGQCSLVEQKCALGHLAKIEAKINNETSGTLRARTPTGSVDTLSIDRLVDNWWECVNFYEIVEQPVDTVR